MYETYENKGLQILAFPCNQFGQQEPRPEKEIEEWVKAKFGVTFPLFEKVCVNGESIHPLWQWL